MTELTEVRRAELLAYCRIDELGPGEEDLLKEFFLDAVSYMADAGVREPAAEDARRSKYDLCVNALVLDSWEHRGTQNGDRTLAENPAFRRRLNQLKQTEPVSDSDTSGE